MKLLPVIRTAFVCATCGTEFDDYPSPTDQPCCLEPGERHERSELLTVSEVAERAKVSSTTVKNWVNRGFLRATRVEKVIRVKVDDLEAFLTENATRP